MSEALTVIFHGRRDLGTIQTYVANGGRGAGAAVAAAELLRVPCDLDLADAEDRDEAEAALRRAGEGDARRDRRRGHRADVWREPLARASPPSTSTAASH